VRIQTPLSFDWDGRRPTMKPNQIIHLIIFVIFIGGLVGTLPRASACILINPDARIDYENKRMPAMPIVRALNEDPQPGSVFMVGTHMYRWHLEREWVGMGSGGWVPEGWEYTFEESGCKWLFIRESEAVRAPVWCRLVDERGNYKLYEVPE
jgi:hypothetical protein